VSREGVDKPFKVTVVRDKIRVKSIKHRVLEPGYGYVRITQFQERTGEDLIKAIDDLKKKSKKAGFNGLVLDLRNNPGGLLDAAVAVSDAFLTEGIIVSVRGRHRESQHSFQATPIDHTNGVPLVVLVNGGSASASEIVAGALQDHKRAVIMGTQTFGKGSVQSIVKLGNNTALKMTTARYYTPNDRTIQAKGITPDIKISHVEVAVKEGGNQYIKESDLKGHLMNDKNPDVEKKKKSKKKKKAGKKEKPLASKDYPLYEALNLLKGLHLLSAKK